MAKQTTGKPQQCELNCKLRPSVPYRWSFCILLFLVISPLEQTCVEKTHTDYTDPETPAAHFTAIFHLLKLKVPRQVGMDLPKDCKQAWMSSSQLAPLVRCPRAIIDLPGVVWAGLGLWNL